MTCLVKVKVMDLLVTTAQAQVEIFNFRHALTAFLLPRSKNTKDKKLNKKGRFLVQK